MPPGDVIIGEEVHLTSKSRRFLNGLDSIFYSKRSTAHHRRGASLDSSTVPSSRSHWHPKVCEQTRVESTQHSVRHHESTTIRGVKCEISKDKDERRGRASLWARILGRIAGKSRVPEEISGAGNAKPSSKVRSQPSKKYKWVSCEDLSRVISSEKDRCGHDELIKPVLEPVHFTATVDRPEPTRKTARKMKLEIPPDQRVIEECTSVASHLRSSKNQSAAAVEARALATTHPVARATLTSLGAVAPLVAMLDSPSSRSAALLALHALASGNDPNKAAIVDAGAVPKMLQILEETDAEESVVANLVSLSALDRNKPLLASAIPPLVARGLGRDSLRALYNLSLAQSNVKVLVESNAATAVMGTLTMHLADHEKALAILGNMVATPVGRNSVASSGIEPLISALQGRSVKCQERASYILMVIAHHSPEIAELRRAIPALLEVSLLGSALAQKRAVRVLECLREENRSLRPVSAPMGHAQLTPPHPHKNNHSDSIPAKLVHDLPASGSKIVNHMVRESLERNLERIVRRANLPALDHVRCPSSSCTSSKSLPF